MIEFYATKSKHWKWRDARMEYQIDIGFCKVGIIVKWKKCKMLVFVKLSISKIKMMGGAIAKRWK